MKLRMILNSRRRLSLLLSQCHRMSDRVLVVDRLMLFEEEHSDPVALTEILLETSSSITHSLGKRAFPSLWLTMVCLFIHPSFGGWLIEGAQNRHPLSERTFCPSLHCAAL